MVGLYPSISHRLGLRGLKEALEKPESKYDLINDLMKLLNLDSKIITLSLMKMLIIDPFHATGLFLYPLKTSGGIERDQWHEID